MNILAHGSDAPGIRGNANLEEIFSFCGFKDLLQFAEEKGINQSNIDSIVRTDPNIGKSMRVKRLRGLEIETLRHLKSSIANQLCLRNFETFLDNCSNLGKDEIPLIQKNQSHTWSLSPVKTDDLLNLEGESIIETTTMLGISLDKFDMYGHLELFKEQYDNYIAINDAIVLFNRSLTEYFKNLGNQLYNETHDKEIVPLLTVHSLIDEYLFHVNEKLYGRTSIRDINLNTNGRNLQDFLEQRVVKEFEMPSVEEVSTFLSKQTKTMIQYTPHTRNATLHNANMYYFDTNERVFMLLEGTHLPDYIENAPGIGGCPFARTKVSDGQNALKKMLNFTDECHMKILEVFRKQGYIN